MYIIILIGHYYENTVKKCSVIYGIYITAQKHRIFLTAEEKL